MGEAEWLAYANPIPIHDCLWPEGRLTPCG
jgi:hypothetical protein